MRMAAAQAPVCAAKTRIPAFAAMTALESTGNSLL